MRIIRVSGTPHERGVSFGQQCGPGIRKNLGTMGFFAVRACMPDFRRGRPRAHYNLITLFRYRRMKEQLIARAREYEELLRGFWPEMIEEIEGIAEGAEVPYDDLLLFNLLGDIFNACSAWAACGEASRDLDPLLAMTTDEEKIVAPNEVIKIIEPEDGYKVIGTTMAGWAQLNSGMNEKSLAMAFPLLWLLRDEEPWRGMPAIALNRPFYECQNVGEALNMLQPLGSVAAAMAHYIADENSVARIEWARQDREVTLIKNGTLSNTNRPETERFKERDASLEWNPSLTMNALTRQKRMAQLLDRHRGAIDAQAMMDIASDHGEGDTKGKSICQHSATPIGVATVTAMVAQPRARKLWISGCTPCKTGFQEISF